MFSLSVFCRDSLFSRMKRKSVDDDGEVGGVAGGEGVASWGRDEGEVGGGSRTEGKVSADVRAVVVVVEVFPAPVLEDETVEEVEVVKEGVATVVEEDDDEEEASAGKETVMDVVIDPLPVLVVLVEMVTGPKSGKLVLMTRALT